MWNLLESIIHFFIYKVFRLKLSEGKYQAFIQFVKFGIVGVSNTVISYVLYAVTLLGLQKAGLLPKIDYLVAQVVAFVLSVLWSFYWNNKFVFTMKEGQTRNMWKALAKTYVSYSFTGLFLNSILLILWVQLLGISEFIAPIINLIISVPLNFIINKFWAFKAK
ncbi:GtrA family protein [Pseudobutyrivibrio xylanivorans]|uniref:GtrA family protein n=1 Tax=Pseudobutyrivibrio xylanivorans TaxID=185007 RepID=A0A5P6VU74_PSEXY|nr:GtrA family protein [Pseudobutyrivibrio xylanivorans]QFJ56137.1 GtrA family protein [Pseudobutyrivibrio xylanivorans]